MYRLFVALDLPASIKQELVAISYGVPGARWLEPEQMHLTLRFIGEVDGSVFRDVEAALEGVHAEPFELSLKGVGYFPPRNQPHDLWVGVEPCEALVRLRNKIESTLVRAGLPPEGRKFSPHVVIGRLKETKLNKLADFLARNGLLRLPPFSVDRFNLYSSHLGSQGASYEIEQEYHLTGGGATHT